MDYVENTFWKIDLFEEFNDVHNGSWYSFGWFQNEGIATGDCQWEHPEGNHSWEIEC